MEVTSASEKCECGVILEQIVRNTLPPLALFILICRKSRNPTKSLCDFLHIHSYILIVVMISHLLSPEILHFEVPGFLAKVNVWGTMLKDELEQMVSNIIVVLLYVLLGLCYYVHDEEEHKNYLLKAMLHNSFFQELYLCLVHGVMLAVPLLLIVGILYKSCDITLSGNMNLRVHEGINEEGLVNFSGVRRRNHRRWSRYRREP